MNFEEFNQIDIVVKKETHNIEYAIIIPVALFLLILFRAWGIKLPPEYGSALFGVSIYTPLTWALFDIYSLYKTQGRYIYKVEIQSYNILIEILFGIVAYFVTQITMFILGYREDIFGLMSYIYFTIAFVGVEITRLIDRKLLQIGGYGNVTFGFFFTFLFLYFYTQLVLCIF